MGTRADFYVGRDVEAEWLGSIAWDGYPSGIDEVVLRASTEGQWRETVAAFLAREDGTLSEAGWPWPWDDSNTTDYAYAFEDGKVYGSCFGHPWFAVDVAAEGYGEPDYDGDEPKGLPFPNMADRRNMPRDSKHSGVIIVSSHGVA